MDLDRDNTIFTVIVSQEGQFTIWQQDRELLPGWRAVGQSGTKQECIDYIQEVWTAPPQKNLRDNIS